MSERTINVVVDAGWSPTDILQLYRGSENAADLASSSSVVRVDRKRVGNASVGSVISMTFDYSPADLCAALPVGVSVVDAAGNESTKTEILLQLNDPPTPPGRPDVAATANPGEAQLTWTASPDL